MFCYVPAHRPDESGGCASRLPGQLRGASDGCGVAPGQAVMVVADSKQSLTITGNGDVLEPHDGVIGGVPALPYHCVHGCASVWVSEWWAGNPAEAALPVPAAKCWGGLLLCMFGYTKNFFCDEHWSAV